MFSRFYYVSPFIVLFFSISLYFILTPFAHAQLLPEGAEITLNTSPEFPEPNSAVLVSLDDYSINTLGATIQWFVDGVEMIGSRNYRSITVQSGSLGEKRTVRVVLSQKNALPLSATITIIPTSIDIIIEADTHVPSFYNGRALPSSLAPIRVIAVVHDITGSDKSEYSYKWSEDATVLMGGPVKGKNVLFYNMPQFADSELSVEVINGKGVSIGRKVIPIDPVEPELHFYEYSSLRGLEERAISSPFSLIANETTLYGEPYFMNAHLRDSNMLYTWEVDGKEIPYDSVVPNAILLKKQDNTGNGSVSLQIVVDATFPQYVRESLDYIF